MSMLNIINACPFPTFVQKNRSKGESDSTLKPVRLTSTLFTIDDKHPIPLVSYHHDNSHEVHISGGANAYGEMKITKKQNSNKDEFFIDFLDDSVTENTNKDSDIYAIIAIPTCGNLEQMRVTAYSPRNDVKVALHRTRVVRYGKQEVNVKLDKKGEIVDGTWGFDKVMYLLVSIFSAERLDGGVEPELDYNIPINLTVYTTINHCGKFEKGTINVTTRGYKYNLNFTPSDVCSTTKSTITVKYIEKRTATEKPMNLRMPDNLWEINPYEKKPDKVKSTSNEKFANKPHWKNN